MGLQQIVEVIDVPDPIRAAMDDLGQVDERRRAEVQQLLALEVAFGALAGDGGDERRAVIGEDRALSGTSAGRG